MTTHHAQPPVPYGGLPTPQVHTHQSRGRHGRAWRALKARVHEEESHCWWCGAWVDQTLDRRHPHSRSVDHLIQLQHDGDPLDRANAHLAHRTCNVSRSNRLRGLIKQLCACSHGQPCARLTTPPPSQQPQQPNLPYLSVDATTI